MKSLLKHITAALQYMRFSTMDEESEEETDSKETSLIQCCCCVVKLELLS